MNIDAQFHLEQLSDFRRIIMVSLSWYSKVGSATRRRRRSHSIIKFYLSRYKYEYPYRSTILAINAVNYQELLASAKLLMALLACWWNAIMPLRTAPVIRSIDGRIRWYLYKLVTCRNGK